MLKIDILKSYKKDFKRLKNSGSFNENTLVEIISTLVRQGKLDEKYKDHQLKGTLSNLRECHVENDLLLVYEIDKQAKMLHLVEIGTHSELFG